MEFGVKVDPRQVQLKLDEFPVGVQMRILGSITTLTSRLEARVKAEEPERSGKLRSETRSRVYHDANKISGRVFVGGDFSERTKRGSVWAGQVAALEYGAHAAVGVRAHQARLDHIYSRAIPPIVVDVDPFTRRANIAEHRFLRGPLAEMSEEALSELRQALDLASETAGEAGA